MIPSARLLCGALLMAGLSTALLPSQVLAQPEGKRLGIGVVVGGFSGASFKYHVATDGLVDAIDLHVSLEIGSDLATMGHVLHEQPLPDSPLTLLAGIGVVFEHRDDSAAYGSSGTLGFLFEKYRFDVFMQVFPQVIFGPDMDSRLRWSVGIRYFF